jgi:hypothetical protein
MAAKKYRADMIMDGLGSRRRAAGKLSYESTMLSGVDVLWDAKVRVRVL